MGISIEQFRLRIGRFLPNKCRIINLCNQYGTNFVIRSPYKAMVLVFAVVVISFASQKQYVKSQEVSLKFSSSSINFEPISVQQISSYYSLSNFSARYTYGNKLSRGIKIAHFNKGNSFLISRCKR